MNTIQHLTLNHSDMKVSHILVPTDFSDTSAKALKYAIRVARVFDARITMVHSIGEPYNYAPMYAEFSLQLESNVSEYFREMLDKVKETEQIRDISISTKTITGTISRSVINEAKDQKADLIIMGTTGATGLAKLLFGSNTSEIMLHSPVPVLAVPKKYDGGVPEHISFFSDYKESDMEALKHTIHFASKFRAAVTAVHITLESDFKSELFFRGFRQMVLQESDYPKLDVKQVKEYSFFTGVSVFTGQVQTSLLVMVRHNKPFFHRLTNTDHSKEMACYSRLPLLVIPAVE